MIVITITISTGMTCVYSFNQKHIKSYEYNQSHNYFIIIYWTPDREEKSHTEVRILISKITNLIHLSRL